MPRGSLLENSALIDAWSEWMAAGGASPGTVRTRRAQLTRIARRVDFASADESALVAAVNALGDLAPESRRGVVGALRSLYGWALPRGYVASDPAAGLRPVKVPQGLPRPIPERILRQLIADADAPTRLMLLLGAYAGLRRAEIARVHAQDFDGEYLRVVGKGGKVRRVPVHPALVRELQALHGWAFPSSVRWGQPVTPDFVSDRLSNVLPTPYTPHSLRHRFATMAYRGTHDLRAVQTLLGHVKPETTARYTLIGDDDLRRAVDSIAA